MKKIISYILHPSKILLYAMNKNYLFFLPDKIYLKIKFRLKMGKKLDLNNPQTFNEKIQWLKLYDRKDNYTMMADKYKVREYIKEKIGEEYLIPLLGVYDKFEDIDFSALPNKFVIKPNHTSGDIYIYTDTKKLDKIKLKKMINKWLKRDYYKIHREWPYKNIERKIVIEQFMEDNKEKDLKDYKFYCFNGVPKYIVVISDRFTDFHETYFDDKWNLLDLTEGGKPIDKKQKKPKNYDKMIEFSKILSKDIPCLRVDWYEVNGKLYFGELTFYSNSGYEKFDPESYNLKMGKLIDLRKRK